MSALPPAPYWQGSPHIGILFETGSPDCGYDPDQRTATGTGSATSACQIDFAVAAVQLSSIE